MKNTINLNDKHMNTKGAMVNSTTYNKVLDIFATFGTKTYFAKHQKAEIKSKITDAYNENELLTLKALFFIRDIREGQGARDVFRISMTALADLDSELVSEMIPLFGHYGRYDDLLSLFDTSSELAMITYVKKELILDSVIASMYNRLVEDNPSKDNGEILYKLTKSKTVASIRAEGFDISVNPLGDLLATFNTELDFDDSLNNVVVSLLAKWLPSINASSKNTCYLARKLARGFEMTHAEYQKTLSQTRKVLNLVETKLSNKEYDFDYSKLPSKALAKYKNAFGRNDKERYLQYISDLVSGVKVAKTTTLYPHEVISPLVQTPYEVAKPMQEEIDLANSQWKAMSESLAKLIPEGDEFIPVLDKSASMAVPISSGHFTCYQVALGLSLLLAENNKGHFKNKVLPFAENTQLFDVTGDTLYEKVNSLARAKVGYSTDYAKTFEYILRYATNRKLTSEQMPKALVYISDMEFESTTHYNPYSSRSGEVFNVDYYKRKFTEFGYTLPQIIFWNVADNDSGFLSTAKEENISLLGGYSKNNLHQVISGEIESPVDTMLRILNSPRYDLVEYIYNNI